MGLSIFATYDVFQSCHNPHNNFFTEFNKAFKDILQGQGVWSVVNKTSKVAIELRLQLWMNIQLIQCESWIMRPLYVQNYPNTIAITFIAYIRYSLSTAKGL